MEFNAAEAWSHGQQEDAVLHTMARQEKKRLLSVEKLMVNLSFP